MDVSGSGNNFAHGHYSYGPQYRSKFEEGLRKNAEHCDSLQTFLVTHSLGGGTGSGVGTYLLSMLSDLYPKIYKFSACVYPSEENDVVTSPYNTVLAMKELVDHADCVFPMDNSSLFHFARAEAANQAKGGASAKGSTTSFSASTTSFSAMGGGGKGKGKDKDRGFDAINNIAARMLCQLTSSSRFHGEMNVDLNEIYTNLVPFPRLHFLMTALSVRQPPLPPSSGATRQRAEGNIAAGSGAALQRAFNDIFSPRGQAIN
jgi:tubulin epsilon